MKFICGTEVKSLPVVWTASSELHLHHVCCYLQHLHQREVFPLVTSHLVPLGLGGVAVDSGLGLVGEEAEGVDLQRAVQI